MCLIDQCNSGPFMRGWCVAHYERWRRHGDPLGGGPPRASSAEPARYFRDTVLAYEGDDCLAWPFCRDRNGYGKMGGKIVSRLVCEKEHGPPPTPAHEAAHSCGKGHEACVAKRHLSWKTRAENASERVIHGKNRKLVGV